MLQAPGPAAAMNRKIKQKSTADSPWFIMGESTKPLGAWSMLSRSGWRAGWREGRRLLPTPGRTTRRTVRRTAKHTRSSASPATKLADARRGQA